ncbi:MAG TPA: motility associated factor glycosyltransferase family protein [Clostridiales bacterium]|nr:motility associated factor glycosyltransferase family protein [Clostridiales bacterium]
MKESIEKIFKQNIKLIAEVDKIIYYFRIQNYDPALRLMVGITGELSLLIEDLLDDIEYISTNIYPIEAEHILNVMNGLLKAQECRDYIYLVDLFEIHVITLLTKLQEGILMQFGLPFDEKKYLDNINAISELKLDFISELKPLKETTELLGNGYSIVPTSSGLPTLAIETEEERYYLHSNHRVENEAFILANSWYDLNKDMYIVYGLGLGYHISQLANLDDNITIEVYESDINVINLACMFADLKDIIKRPNVRLIYDPKYIRLIDRVSKLEDNEEFVLHHPSVRNIKNNRVREELESYFIQQSSVRNQIHLLNGNFKHNIRNFNYTVDDLKEEFQGKDLYIIAAGPSLDKNFKKLKDVGGKGIILATGTVFRKLINEGIVPNYVIITDANKRVYAQIRGLEESKVPMLFLSTAYRGFARKYKGDKYIIMQKGYSKAEDFARDNNFQLYETGGSVATTALDIGIRLDCRRIIFLGLDLAYTDDYVHASGTSRRDLNDNSDLIETIDIYGNPIKTTKVLNIYRKWIEERIKNVRDIEIIDATEGGMKIKGMVYRGGVI